MLMLQASMDHLNSCSDEYIARVMQMKKEDAIKLAAELMKRIKNPRRLSDKNCEDILDKWKLVELRQLRACIEAMGRVHYDGKHGRVVNKYLCEKLKIIWATNDNLSKPSHGPGIGRDGQGPSRGATVDNRRPEKKTK